MLTANPGSVQSADMVLTFDSTVAQLISVQPGDLPGDWSIASNSQVAGTARIGLAGVSDPTDDTVLARLVFQAIGERGQSSEIVFEQAPLNEGQIVSEAWNGRITIGTPPVTDLLGEDVGSSMVLRWTHTGDGIDHYELWRAEDDPYFTPGAAGTLVDGDIQPAQCAGYEDAASGMGDPNLSSFYVIVAVDETGWPSPTSNRVGEFDFALQAGAGP
jgi:hypothetical protein